MSAPFCVIIHYNAIKIILPTITMMMMVVMTNNIIMAIMVMMPAIRQSINIESTDKNCYHSSNPSKLQ